MASKPRDPLLAAAKVLVILSQIVTVFAMVMVAIALGAMFTIGHDEAMAEIAKAGAPDYAIWLLLVAFLLIEGIIYLAYRFLDELRGIINSVGEGEPFRPENAVRLSRMGWISVGGHVLIVAIAALAAWFAPYLDDDKVHYKIDGAFDGGSILLTLILFILARVFREGTRMREELEGTV
jgi:sterol desaturase/sphingolipid hydroxylase (fatty acid hydroxylase superfamily)